MYSILQCSIRCTYTAVLRVYFEACLSLQFLSTTISYRFQYYQILPNFANHLSRFYGAVLCTVPWPWVWTWNEYWCVRLHRWRLSGPSLSRAKTGLQNCPPTHFWTLSTPRPYRRHKNCALSRVLWDVTPCFRVNSKYSDYFSVLYMSPTLYHLKGLRTNKLTHFLTRRIFFNMHPFHLRLTWESLFCLFYTLKIYQFSTGQDSCQFIQRLSCFVFRWIGSKPYIKFYLSMMNNLYIGRNFFTRSPNNPTSQFWLLRWFCTNPYKKFWSTDVCEFRIEWWRKRSYYFLLAKKIKSLDVS